MNDKQEIFNTRPSAVNAWMQELPLGHVGETARQIYHALRNVNQQESVPAKDLFHFLETVSEPLNLILPELHRHYVGKPLPLSFKRRKISDLYTQLLRQTVAGYQRLIGSSIELGRFGWKKVVTTAVHRIFYYQGLMLCNYRLLYMPFPRNTWQQSFWLYNLIEKNEMLDSKVQCINNPGSKTMLGDEFKKLLLITLLSPNLFKLEELHHVLEMMDVWVQHTRIDDMRSPGATHQYAFVMGTDIAPGLVATDSTSSDNNDNMRYFDITPLLNLIDTKLKQAKDGVEEIAVQKQRMMGRRSLLLLLNNWGRPPVRDSERRPVQGQTEIAIGLSAIHYILGEGRTIKDPPVAAQKPATTTTRDEFSLSIENDDSITPSSFNLLGFNAERDKKHDIWDTAYFEPEPPPPSWTDSIRMKAYTYLPARIVNISANGLCVTMPQESIEHIQTGELITVRSKNGQWYLGEIRWMVCPSTGPIRAGIKRLCDQLKPVQLHILDKSHSTQPFRALLGQQQDSMILFLPTIATRLLDKRLGVEYNAITRRIVIDEPVYVTPMGSAYRIQWEDEKLRSAGSTSTAAGQDHFETVWATL